MCPILVKELERGITRTRYPLSPPRVYGAWLYSIGMLGMSAERGGRSRAWRHARKKKVWSLSGAHRSQGLNLEKSTEIHRPIFSLHILSQPPWLQQTLALCGYQALETGRVINTIKYTLWIKDIVQKNTISCFVSDLHICSTIVNLRDVDGWGRQLSLIVSMRTWVGFSELM